MSDAPTLPKETQGLLTDLVVVLAKTAAKRDHEAVMTGKKQNQTPFKKSA